MQDVIREAGLSVGAVYRYFRSKDDLVKAIAERNIGRLGAAAEAMIAEDPPLPVEEAVDRAIVLVEDVIASNHARIALQLWTESLRSPELNAFVRAAYGRLRDAFVTIVTRARDAGHAPADVDAASIGVALFSLMPGFLLQRLLTGTPSVEAMRAGARALVTTAMRAGLTESAPPTDR
jgi:AcrR family transcriptional regulator